MKTVNFVLLLFSLLFSCSNDLDEYEIIEGKIELRAVDEYTYWGYTSEKKLAHYDNFSSFDSSLWDIGWNPSDPYEVDYYEITKEIIVPTGYTAQIMDTPNAGYKPGYGWNRGITGRMVGNKFIMSTMVYAVRKNARTGALVNKYMPKININSNNLQELPWNVRLIRL